MTIQNETFLDVDSNQTYLINSLYTNIVLCKKTVHYPVPDEEYNLLLHCFDDAN